jgi:hypothetical protein
MEMHQHMAATHGSSAVDLVHLAFLALVAIGTAVHLWGLLARGRTGRTPETWSHAIMGAAMVYMLAR